MQILRNKTELTLAVQLADMPVKSTFLTDFQISDVGLAPNECDVWFKTADVVGGRITVANLTTGSVHNFDAATKVVPLPTYLVRSDA
jgi:hypothetical protein